MSLTSYFNVMTIQPLKKETILSTMGLRKKDILNVISFFQSLKGVVRRFGMSRVTQYFRYSQYISLNPQ